MMKQLIEDYTFFVECDMKGEEIDNETLLAIKLSELYVILEDEELSEQMINEIVVGVAHNFRSEIVSEDDLEEFLANTLDDGICWHTSSITGKLEII